MSKKLGESLDNYFKRQLKEDRELREEFKKEIEDIEETERQINSGKKYCKGIGAGYFNFKSNSDKCSCGYSHKGFHHGKWLPISKFNKVKDNDDGLSTYCKSCNNARMAYYKHFKPKIIKNMTKYHKQHHKQHSQEEKTTFGMAVTFLLITLVLILIFKSLYNPKPKETIKLKERILQGKEYSCEILSENRNKCESEDVICYYEPNKIVCMLKNDYPFNEIEGN